jgi:signal transduction histidine kinase
MNTTSIDLEIHRFVFKITAQVRTAADPDKLLRHYLRSTAELMEADHGCIASMGPSRELRVRCTHPHDAECDLDLVESLLGGEQRPIPRGTICARITRRGRPWGMIVLVKRAGGFPDGYPRALGHVADEVSDLLERRDQERLSEVRARIDGKMMRELPPKDLYYQVLDGLHQLTRYDHSAALWIWNPALSSLELVAEQVAWRKMKSTIIGRTTVLDTGLHALLGDGVVYGFDRDDGAWREWTPHGAVELARLLDLGGAADVTRPDERAMLCAALGAREGPLGLLKLSALHPETFRDHELAIVERFTLLASLALQRARTIESLQSRMLKLERQNALAHLARGVAHDINNALGQVLPLVQQIRADLKDDRLDPVVLADDLERIEHALQVTRGIFGRMMRFARGSTKSLGPGDVALAFDTVRGVMRDTLTRGRITLHDRIDPALPAVRCGQSDLERLLLNLMSNARDAMPDGGTLEVAARGASHHVELVIADQGVGMTHETLREIERPFFTTKEHGTGLGLSTCRSIVAEAGGELAIESEPGVGTRVTAHLPPAPLEAAGDE